MLSFLCLLFPCIKQLLFTLDLLVVMKSYDGLVTGVYPCHWQRKLAIGKILRENPYGNVGFLLKNVSSAIDGKTLGKETVVAGIFGGK